LASLLPKEVSDFQRNKQKPFHGALTQRPGTAPTISIGRVALMFEPEASQSPVSKTIKPSLSEALKELQNRFPRARHRHIGTHSVIDP
jgi:hypothetical protein